MARGIVTGTTFRNQELDFTTLRDSSVQSRHASAEAGPPNLFEQVSAAASQIKGEIHHALPAHRTLLRVFDFPADDPEEIEGMVDLQMDKIAPFPVEHMYVSHEVLQQSEGMSRVLIAATQKKWVDHAGESFQTAGLDVTRIDVDVLGWMHLLKASGSLPERGRHIVIFMDGSGTEMVLVEDAIPLGFRSLGILDEDETEAEFMDDLVDELDYSLTSLEGEWGAEPVDSLTVWHRGSPPQGIDRLGPTAGVSMRTQNLETLGPLSEGVALRANEHDKNGRFLTDLSPGDWLERIKDKEARRGLYLAALAMLTLFLLYILGVILFSQFQNRQLEEVAAQAKALKVPSEEVSEMSRNVGFLREFTNRERSSLETLKRLTDQMPPGLTVSSFNYNKKDGEVKVQGKTTESELVNRWIGNLGASGDFKIPAESTYRKKSTRGGGWDFGFEGKLLQREETDPVTKPQASSQTENAR